MAVSQNRLPAAAVFPMEVFMEISFTHHMEILHKTKELDERLFYIRECAAGHWSKTALRTRLKENLYQHKGALINNFSIYRLWARKELPASYKILAPIIEEVPKMLDEAKYMEDGEDE